MAVTKAALDPNQIVKVKLNTRMAGPEGVFFPGQTLEMNLSKAVDLVAGNYAEFAEPEKFVEIVSAAQDKNAAQVAKEAQDKANAQIEKAQAQIEKVKARQEAVAESK